MKGGAAVLLQCCACLHADVAQGATATWGERVSSSRGPCGGNTEFLQRFLVRVERPYRGQNMKESERLYPVVASDQLFV